MYLFLDFYFLCVPIKVNKRLQIFTAPQMSIDSCVQYYTAHINQKARGHCRSGGRHAVPEQIK